MANWCRAVVVGVRLRYKDSIRHQVLCVRVNARGKLGVAKVIEFLCGECVGIVRVVVVVLFSVVPW